MTEKIYRLNKLYNKVISPPIKSFHKDNYTLSQIIKDFYFEIKRHIKTHPNKTFYYNTSFMKEEDIEVFIEFLRGDGFNIIEREINFDDITYHIMIYPINWVNPECKPS